MKLEVQPQRELYLTVRSEADGTFDGLPQQAKRRAGSRLRIGLSRLQSRTSQSWQAHVQSGTGKREVCVVEDIEDLRAEFKSYRLRDWETLVEDEMGREGV